MGRSRKLSQYVSTVNTRLGNRPEIWIELIAVKEKYNGPVKRPVLRQYIANLMCCFDGSRRIWLACQEIYYCPAKEAHLTEQALADLCVYFLLVQ